MVALADIQTSLAALDEADPVDQIRGAIQLADRLHAFAGTETLRMLETGRIHRDGLSNAGNWLAHKTRSSKGRSQQIVANARLFDRFPSIGQAIDEGAINADHLAQLRRCLPKNRTRFRAAAFDTAHKVLLDIARDETFDDFRLNVLSWIGLCDDQDPDTTAPEEQDLHLRFTDNTDGTTSIRGLLLTTDAETLRAGLTLLAEKAKEAERLAQNKHDAAADVAGDEPTGSEGETGGNYSISEYTLRPVTGRGTPYWMARSVGMLATLANTAPADGKTPDPLVVILMDWETFNEEKDRWAQHRPPPDPDIVFGPGYTCQTLNGNPVTPQEGFRAALNGRVTRCVINAESRKVDLGRTSRLFTGAGRDAITWRDRTCQTPGCGAPARWCQADHIQEWQDQGPTDTINGELRCGPCHKLKTQAAAQHRQRQRNTRPDLDPTEPF